MNMEPDNMGLVPYNFDLGVLEYNINSRQSTVDG